MNRRRRGVVGNNVNNYHPRGDRNSVPASSACLGNKQNLSTIGIAKAVRIVQKQIEIEDQHGPVKILLKDGKALPSAAK